MIVEQFTLDVEGRRVPAALWRPEVPTTSLVLIGHGGSGHKRDNAVHQLADPLINAHRVAVLSLDGPVHGDRRADGGQDPESLRRDWTAWWQGDPRYDDMVADWLAALQAATERLHVRQIGYIGLSMGTLFGLPLLAAAPQISAAAIGMWGVSNHTGNRLLGDATNTTSSVLFHMKWDDQIFDRAGVLALFDAIGTTDKRLCAYPGPHANPDPDQREVIVNFVISRLREDSHAVHPDALTTQPAPPG